MLLHTHCNNRFRAKYGQNLSVICMDQFFSKGYETTLRFAYNKFCENTGIIRLKIAWITISLKTP